MLHLIKSHWGWLFGALTIGVIIGGAMWHRARGRWVDRALSLGAAVVAAGILVAYLDLVHGRAGARLDLVLAIIGICAIGYVFGWLIRDVADVPALADVGWPAAPPMLDGIVRPPYFSKPGQIPWAVVVGGPDAVAAWTAKRAGASTIGRGMEAAPAAAKPSSEPAASASPSTVSSVSRGSATAVSAPGAPTVSPPPVSPAPRPTPTVAAAPVSITAASAVVSSADRDGSHVSQKEAPESVVASSPISSRSDGPASVPVPASPALRETEPVQGSLVSSSADKAGSAELPLSPLESTAAAPSAGPGASLASTARPVVAAAPSQVPEPAPCPPVLDQEKHGGTRPAGLVTARGGTADNLTRIKGIGPQNETRLHGLGIWHFAQIASWTPDNVHWVGSYLAFPGRIDREKWVEQAAVLAAGGAGAKDGLAGKPRPRR